MEHTELSDYKEQFVVLCHIGSVAIVHSSVTLEMKNVRKHGSQFLISCGVPLFSVCTKIKANMHTVTVICVPHISHMFFFIFR